MRLFAPGQGAISLLFGLGQIATGYQAVGQIALGWIAAGQIAFADSALGQLAFDQYVYGAKWKDPQALELFRRLIRWLGRR